MLKRWKWIGWIGNAGVVLAVLTATLPMAQATEHAIESVAPSALEARLKAHKGTIVVNITSVDPNCTYCVGANVKFAAKARSADAAVKFIQVSWSPWGKFPSEITPFLNQLRIGGIPARLTYRDGVLVEKLVGEPPNDPAPAVVAVSPAAPQNVTGTVPLFAPNYIVTQIAKTPGLLVVELTSFETSCTYCMRGNPVFESFAENNPVRGAQFARVTYRPWPSVGSDPFAMALQVSGLPAYFTYRDGKLVRQKMGAGSAAELQKELLDGL